MNAYPLFSSNIRQGHFWPVVEACYSRTWDHYEMQPHIHNRAEIMYVLKGRCMVHLYEYLTKIESQGIRITPMDRVAEAGRVLYCWTRACCIP
jgi:hypothetical protein